MPENAFARYLGVGGMPESPELAARRAREARADRLARLRHVEVPLEGGMTARVAGAEISTEETTGALEMTAMLEHAVALVHVAQASENHHRIALYMGSLGRGKTTACAYVIAHLDGLYVRMQEAYELRASKLLTDRAEWAKLIRARVLAVDEVGVEPDDEMSRTTLQELVDLRQERITVFATNLDRKGRDGLERRYNPRTLDRLDTGDVVVSGGKSFRGRRPWRKVLDVDPRATITHERLEQLVADKRAYYVAKGWSPIESAKDRDGRDREGIELFVELTDCYRAALTELGPRPRSREAA